MRVDAGAGVAAEPNSDLLQELSVLLTAESSLQSHEAISLHMCVCARVCT